MSTERPTPNPVPIAFFYSRFPHLTETFLQRELRGMWKCGFDPRLYSFHGGERSFEGSPVIRFSKWRLLELFWRLPVEWFRRPVFVLGFALKVFAWRPRYWMNYWENLYGAGIAVVLAGDFRKNGIRHVHAVWASLPAMCAWLLSELTGTSFNVGAHAYDLFDHGGDHFLRDKCMAAQFVHTSTSAGMERLVELGIPADKIALIRRGLDQMPVFRALRVTRKPLRMVCVARLVEKKGLFEQLAIYRFALDAGLHFSARIFGGGPLGIQLQAAINQQGLASNVTLLGPVSNETIWEELGRADVLVHTGIVSSSGDRDGLPNVVPEAMAAGVIVVTAPSPGVEEAITAGNTGFVCSLNDLEAWKAAFTQIQGDTDFCQSIRSNARSWVEENFDAVRNASRLIEWFHSAIERRRDFV
jgi:colanic acid/amylovoran biosynthesis glycosyltransferase